MSASKFFPAVEVLTRCHLPEHLYVVVDDVAFPTISEEDGLFITSPYGDIQTKQNFFCEDITHDRLRAHFRDRRFSAMQSCFISTFDNDDIALANPPFCASGLIKGRPAFPHTTKLIIDTSTLHAGWIDTISGRIPVWLEHGELPKVPKGVLYMTPEGIEAFDARIWICVAEVTEILGLKPHHSEKGEWLACGRISRSMVEAQVVLRTSQRQQCLLTEPVVRRSSSIRSISSKEQEEHMKQQIARNRASKEDLRSQSIHRRQEHSKTSSLLIIAVGNAKAQKQASSNFPAATSKTSPGTQERPRQRSTFPAPPSSTTRINSETDLKNRYASVRSAILRQALERSQTTRANKAVLPAANVPGIVPQNITAELLISSSTSFVDTKSEAGPSCSNRRNVRGRIANEEDAYDQTLREPLVKDKLPCVRHTMHIQGMFDEDRDMFSPSEQLRRAREGKKKVHFFESDDGIETMLESVVQYHHCLCYLLA